MPFGADEKRHQPPPHSLSFSEPLGLLQQHSGVSFTDPASKEILSRCIVQPSSLHSIQSSATPLSEDGKNELDSNASDSTATNRDVVSAREVFDIIRHIQDPEHPLTLQQLNVVNLKHIEVKDDTTTRAKVENDEKEESDFPFVDVRFTPTIPHCSMATLIGLCIRVKLLRSLPARFKVTVRINPGTHASELAVNKQLADKERVRAALENVHLLAVVNRCIFNGIMMNTWDIYLFFLSCTKIGNTF